MIAWLDAALAVAVLTYSLSYAGELLSSDLDSLLRFVCLEYIGAANLPALWLSLDGSDCPTDLRCGRRTHRVRGSVSQFHGKETRRTAVQT